MEKRSNTWVMTAFTYSAVDASGQRTEGQLNASDRAAAEEMLRRDGLMPLDLAERTSAAKSSKRSIGGKKVKPKSLQVFARQFATMIAAGLNVVTALSILEEQTDDPALIPVLRTIRKDVEAGQFLSVAMARHPKVFSELFISMVEAGEASGVLDGTLDRVAHQLEKELQIRRRVKGAMMYPLVVLSFAILILIGLLLFLVPVFTQVFEDLGGELPYLTQLVVAASDFMRNYWFIIFPAAGLGLYGFRRWIGTPNGRYRWDATKLKAPLGIGGVVLKVAIARLSRTLATLIEAGVDIIQALDIAGDTSGNKIIAEATASVRERIRQGERFRSAMSEEKAYPPMVAHMIGVGEETGEMGDMLGKVADFYEDEVDASIQSLTSVIEPVMMIAIGIVVGIIIIAMYLPMFEVLTLIQ